MSYILIPKPYVYIVLEHAWQYEGEGIVDAVVHGVYIDREHASDHQYKLHKQSGNGYISILKKPIRGKKKKLAKIVDRLYIEEK